MALIIASKDIIILGLLFFSSLGFNYYNVIWSQRSYFSSFISESFVLFVMKNNINSLNKQIRSCGTYWQFWNFAAFLKMCYDFCIGLSVIIYEAVNFWIIFNSLDSILVNWYWSSRARKMLVRGQHFYIYYKVKVSLNL